MNISGEFLQAELQQLACRDSDKNKTFNFILIQCYPNCVLDHTGGKILKLFFS